MEPSGRNLLQLARPVRGSGLGGGEDLGDDGVDVGFGRQVSDDAGAEAEATPSSGVS